MTKSLDSFDVNLLAARDDSEWSSFYPLASQFLTALLSRQRGVGSLDQHTRSIEDLVADVFVELLTDDCRVLRTFDRSKGSLRNLIATIALRNLKNAIEYSEPRETIEAPWAQAASA